jgi:hypothetical protein
LKRFAQLPLVDHKARPSRQIAVVAREKRHEGRPSRINRGLSQKNKMPIWF